MVPNVRALVVGGALVVLAGAAGIVGGAEFTTHRDQPTGTAVAVTSTAITTDATASTTAATTTALSSTQNGQKISSDVLAGVRHSEATALAGALQLTPKQLSKDRKNGQTIAQIAQAQNIPIASVSASVLAAAKANLDQAATIGGITPTTEQQEMSHLSSQLAKQLSSTTARRATSATQTSGSATTTTSLPAS